MSARYLSSAQDSTAEGSPPACDVKKIPSGDIKKSYTRFKLNKPSPKSALGAGHENDGTTFGNKQDLLPHATYTEWGLGDVYDQNAQRVVIKQDGKKVFYTKDHYASFCLVPGSVYG